MRRSFFLAIFFAAVAANAQTVTVGSDVGQCGQTLSVPISIDTVPGLLSLEFRIAYDVARVTPGARRRWPPPAWADASPS